MSKNISTVLGLLMVVGATVALIASRFLETSYTPTMALLHIFSGGLALYVGLNATPAGARTFSLFFGCFYLLTSLVGFAVAGADHQWTMWPRTPLFDTWINVLHMAVGIVFLVSGLLLQNIQDYRTQQ